MCLHTFGKKKKKLAVICSQLMGVLAVDESEPETGDAGALADVTTAASDEL